MCEAEKTFKNTQFKICYQHCRILQQQICGPVTDCCVAKTRKIQPVKISVTDDDNSPSTICLTYKKSNFFDVESMISIVANNNQQHPSIPDTTQRDPTRPNKTQRDPTWHNKTQHYPPRPNNIQQYPSRPNQYPTIPNKIRLGPS